jgi:hypothetical protein
MIMSESKNLIPTESTSYGLPADVSGLDAYAKTSALVGADYLRVSGKTGRVAYGVEDTKLPADAKLAALIGMATVGYIDWQDGQNAGEEWLGVADYSKSALKELRQRLGKLDPSLWTERDPKGNPRDPVRESVRLPLLWLQERKPLMFSSSSTAGCNALKNLLRQCLEQAQADCVPVVEIEIDSYQHSVRTIGEVFYPKFNVIDWMPTARVMRIQSGHAAADDPQPRHSRAEKSRKPIKTRNAD